MRDGWLARLWRRCVLAGAALPRGRRAAVALEFALVGPPFVFCLVFILELGYDLYVQEMLDYGMQTAARQIQLGNAQGAGTTANFTSTYFCPAVAGFLSCASISVSVQVVTDFFAAGNQVVPTNGAGHLDTSTFKFCPGIQNQLVLATAVYTSPSIVSVLVPTMAMSTGSSFVRATIATSAFVNENFNGSPVPPAGC